MKGALVNATYFEEIFKSLPILDAAMCKVNVIGNTLLKMCMLILDNLKLQSV